MPTKTHRNTTPTHVPSVLVASSREPARQIEVSPDRTRGRAYEIYNQRCHEGGAGDECSDWVQAERELTS